MGLQKSGYLALFLVLTMIASTAVFFTPGEAVEEPEILTNEEGPGPIVPPTRTVYPGTTYTVGPDPGDDSPTIQGAVDLCVDGDIVSVSPGTYEEEVRVNNEIWIRGADGVILTSPVMPATFIGFYLLAHNVTITEFNITDFEYGISTPYFGHNISSNDFFLNNRDIYIRSLWSSIPSSFNGNGLEISYNTFKRSSSMKCIDVEIRLDHDGENISDSKTGDFIFRDNVFISSSTAGDYIEFDLYAGIMAGGSLDIGNVWILNNVMNGGGLGIDYNGFDVYDLEDVSVTWGALIIRNNQVIEHDDGGFNIDVGDIYRIQGASQFTLDEVIVANNIIRTSGSTESITIIPQPYVYEIYDSTMIRTSNTTVEENTLNGGSYGIYISDEEFAYNIYNNSRIIFKNWFIRNNDILRSGSGIYVYIGDGYELHGDSYVSFEDIVVSNNFVNSTYDGIYLHFSYVGAYMYDNAMMTIGNVITRNNEVHGSVGNNFYSGLELYYEYLGYDMEWGSMFSMGDILITNNDIWGYYGLQWEYFNYIGYDMRGDTSVYVGEINISENRVRGERYGIYIVEFYEIGYDLYDTSIVSLENIIISNNMIWSSGYGLYWDRLEYIGYQMYNSSSMNMENIIVSQNTIISDYSGIYLDSFEYFGYYMYDDSSFTMKDIVVGGNTLRSNSSGLYIYYIEYFGNYMYDNASYDMGNIDLKGNHITSSSEGIYAYYIGIFGNYMYNWSSFSMGSIRFNENNITSEDYGIYIEYIIYFGYWLEQMTSFIMENVEISKNTIRSEFAGQYLYYVEYFAYSLHGMATFEMGKFLFTENHINSNRTGFYIEYIYDLGYDIYDSASASFDGISIDNNTVKAADEGIDLVNIEYFGEDLYDSTRYHFGNITMNNNLILAGGDGLGIADFSYCLSDMDGNAVGEIGWVQINDNQVDSGGKGIYFDSFSGFGSSSGGTSRGNVQGVQIIDNLIVADSYGISMESGKYFARGMNGDSEIRMGPWMVSDNHIESGGKGILVDQNSMGFDMYSGNAVMEGLWIMENTLDTSGGLDVRFASASMTDHANITIEKLIIDGNHLLRASDDDSIYLRTSTSVAISSSFIIENTEITNNEQIGSNVSSLHISHSENEGPNANSDLGIVEIFGNNITGGGTGLEMEGPKRAYVYTNNFIANLDDVTSGSTDITWVSPEPIWYKHEMTNRSNFLGNYWAVYSGPDNNNDGIGDNPFNTGFGLDTKPLMKGTWEILPPWNDETPPVVVIDSPANGSAFMVDNVTVEWTATDDLLGVDTTSVKLDDGGWVEVTGSSYMFTGLTEGEHTLHVKAVDAAGNENSTSVTVTIDMTDPMVEFISPADDSAFNTTTVMATWSGEDLLSGMDVYHLAIGNGNFTDLGNSTEYEFIGLTEGMHQIHLRGYDIAGNMDEDLITIYIDLTRPTVDLIHPSEGMILTDTRVNLTWSGNGGLTGISGYMVSIDGGNFTDAGVKEYMMVEYLSQGEHTITVKATDLAGNWNMTSVSFTVNSSMEAVDITYPSDGSYIGQTSFDARWNLNGMVHPVRFVQFKMDADNYTYAMDGTAAVLGLDEGLHTMVVKVTDILGNTMMATSTFTVDTTTPTVRTVSHEGADAPARGPVVVTYSEIIDEESIVIKTGNDIHQNWTLDGATLTIDIDLDPDMTYNLDLETADRAGNVLSHSIVFTTSAKGTVIGTIVDEDGNTISGAKIVFDTGEEAITNIEGEFSIAVTAGSRTATVYDKEGNEIGTFQAEVIGGDVTDAGEIQVQPIEEEEEFPYWIIIVIAVLVLIIAVAILAFVLMSKAKETEEDIYDEEAWEDDEDEDDYYEDEDFDDVEFEDDWEEDEF